MNELALSWLRLSWCLLPVVFVVAVYWYWNKNSVGELLYAVLRMLCQLVGVGFVLAWLFGNPDPVISVALLMFMLVVSAWIAMRPLNLKGINRTRYWQGAGLALAISVFSHLALTIGAVLPVEQWYSPSILVPLAGMYFANTMNSISLAAERYSAEREQNKPPEIAKLAAFKACMIPQINGLFAVGLVSLPGMMTGQILAGVDPLVAVRYQILIMTMILGTTGTGAFLLLFWVSRKESATTETSNNV